MEEAVSTRRGFLLGRHEKQPTGPYPPGVTGRTIQACTGCGECADICPTGIIVIEGGRAQVDFTRGECTFCGKCFERCPEAVFAARPAARFSHTARIGDGCLALNYVDCQACRDTCPEIAIRFQPRRGAPFQPVLNQDACTGCGACLAVCPVGSISFAERQPEPEHA